MIHRRRVMASGVGALMSAATAARSDTAAGVRSSALDVPASDGRVTPVRVVGPAKPGLHKVLLFSHGAAATNLAYDRVLNVWARQGYVVLAPNHLDAGRTPPEAELSHAQLWTSRVVDMQAVLDNARLVEALGGQQGWRPDWSRLGSTGHSFGALVAQALAGLRATPPVVTGPAPQVKAVLCLSPPGLRKGFVSDTAWDEVRAPLFVETGTADVSPGFTDDWRMHLTSFFAARSKVRWAAVGDKANHVFGGRICFLRDTPDPLQEAPFQATMQTSVAFLDAYVGGSAAAAARLQRDLETQTHQPALTLYRA